MIVKFKDLLIENINPVYSEPVKLTLGPQYGELDIINKDNEISIIDLDSKKEKKDKIFTYRELNIKIKVAPTPLSISRTYSITLSNDKEKENIILTGRIVVNSLTNVSQLIVSGTKCYPSFGNGILKLSLDQRKYIDCSFSIGGDGISVSDGSITDFYVVSKNGIDLRSDAYLANQSISSISFSSNTCSIQLQNPNAGGDPYGNYGFSRETEFYLKFTFSASMYGNEFTINAIISLTYKATDISFRQIRSQRASFDISHRSTLINFDFDLNRNIDGKQFTFGLNKESQYDIPVKLSTIIPRALRIQGLPNLKPLRVWVIAQSIFKVKNYYSAKLIVQIDPPTNRALVSGNYEIPAYIKAQGYKHRFNIPVRLYG